MLLHCSAGSCRGAGTAGRRGSISSGACSHPHPTGQPWAGTGSHITPPQWQHQMLSRLVPPRPGARGQRAVVQGQSEV